MMDNNTARIALEILETLEHEPMDWREICERWGISRGAWTVTYKDAVRQLGIELGMEIPRPVPEDGYKYRATDVWNQEAHPATDADVFHGYRFRLVDEYTRRSTSLAFLARTHDRMDKRGAVAKRIDRVIIQERSCLASMEMAAEALGISLNGET